MEWKIRETGIMPEIINAQLDESMLKWDFRKGSGYDFCAIFLWDGKMSLSEFQRRGIRPMLYHKRLKTRKSVLYDDASILGYRLYPAMLEDDTLYIGNQMEGSGVLRNPVEYNISVHLLNKVKGIFRLKYLPDLKNSVHLSFETPQKKLFYRISSKVDTYPSMCAEVTGEDVWICLRPGEKIRFYRDASCIEEIL